MSTPIASHAPAWLRALLLAVYTATAATGGCAAERATPEPASVSTSPIAPAAPAPAVAAPTGPSAGQWVLDMESAHLRIDAALTILDRAAVRDDIARALSVAVPAGVGTEHRRVVHQDLLFRLAGMELSAGSYEAALRASERGLALGGADDLFTANLLLSGGRANEGLGRDAQAARMYHRALKINEVLLAQVLARDAGAP